MTQILDHFPFIRLPSDALNTAAGNYGRKQPANTEETAVFFIHCYGTCLSQTIWCTWILLQIHVFCHSIPICIFNRPWGNDLYCLATRVCYPRLRGWFVPFRLFAAKRRQTKWCHAKREHPYHLSMVNIRSNVHIKTCILWQRYEADSISLYAMNKWAQLRQRWK